MRYLPVVLALFGPLAASALPSAGQQIPDIHAKDVSGTDQSLHKMLGDDKTLIVAITQRGAEPEMRGWYSKADQTGTQAERVSILSLKLPGFVSADTARSKARAKVPQKFWDETLLDKNGQMANQLGMEGSGDPYVMVVDGEGKVIASYHGDVKGAGAEKIWQALGE